MARMLMFCAALLGLCIVGVYGHVDDTKYNVNPICKTQGVHWKPKRGDPTFATSPFIWVEHCKDISWADADKWCKAHFNTQLASIHCKVSQSWAIKLCHHEESEEKDGNNHCWIGMHDKNGKGQWTWSDGSKIDYQDWSGGNLKHNDPKHIRDCGSMSSDAARKQNFRSWDSHSCGYGVTTFLCKNPNAPDPCYTARPTTRKPTARPTSRPTSRPTGRPTSRPTGRPTTRKPTTRPTCKPTSRPTGRPTNRPTARPTGRPTARPTTRRPTSLNPSSQPSARPTNQVRSARPTTLDPTQQPSARPTTLQPSGQPSSRPTTLQPSGQPSARPTTMRPTTMQPSTQPSSRPTTLDPTTQPSKRPTTMQPSMQPSARPTTLQPTTQPSSRPTTLQPTGQPSVRPSGIPTVTPTMMPTPCADNTTWRDSEGRNCSQYVMQGICDPVTRIILRPDIALNGDGITPQQACCACKNGAQATTPAASAGNTCGANWMDWSPPLGTFPNNKSCSDYTILGYCQNGHIVDFYVTLAQQWADGKGRTCMTCCPGCAPPVVATTTSAAPVSTNAAGGVGSAAQAASASQSAPATASATISAIQLEFSSTNLGQSNARAICAEAVASTLGVRNEAILIADFVDNTPANDTDGDRDYICTVAVDEQMYPSQADQDRFLTQFNDPNIKSVVQTHVNTAATASGHPNAVTVQSAQATTSTDAKTMTSQPSSNNGGKKGVGLTSILVFVAVALVVLVVVGVWVWYGVRRCAKRRAEQEANDLGYNRDMNQPLINSSNVGDSQL